MSIPLLIIAVVFGVLMIFPVYLLVISSLRMPKDIFSANLWPSVITLDNFRVVLKSGFLRSIGNSVFISSVVTLVALLFHAMSGYALAKLQFPGKSFIFSWVLSTLMVPFSVIMIPLFMITKNMGMANNYWGLIIPSIFNAYGIFLFRQFYREFPKELEEAASMEGYSIAGTFFRIVMPLSLPMIVPLTIGFFLANYNSYLWPSIITQKENLWVVQVALASLVGGGYTTPWNVVLAAAVLACIPTFLMFFLMQKYLVNGIKMTGIK
ncbi:carbohydrate ABC transporter permease [Paenibacillus psychroresistens]|uniref:Carbohydrate ABC transporter permease n=2 Tax=Paenibacillus psychroresistens TaxID=1778678 RepID=A0A6B8RWK1_9BACL|nr:carbohydrate ABC transporter permease [Paenibacillus psychroresistens]